ncbi:ribosome biogenesis GTP-binding protein YihA/YsxC [Thermosulfuriphilus sp.]
MKVKKVDFFRSVTRLQDLPPERFPEVAVAGRSNVGKSSLINRLLRRRAVARVSSTPGRTRALNFFNIDDRLYLVDLPGYGFAKGPLRERLAWKSLVEGYLSSRQSLLLVLAIFDIRRRPDELDLALIDYLQGLKFSLVVALNKIDKVNRAERLRAKKIYLVDFGLQPEDVYLISCRTGEGIDSLRGRVFAALR